MTGSSRSRRTGARRPTGRGRSSPYGPYGPRGWQDEYCEWSVARDDAGKIVRVDLVCENPEYWYTLWSISPERVAELYTQTLSAGAPNPVSVTVEDLQLVDPSTGQPVIDPSTGRPAYNPLNKFNRGPFSIRGGPDAAGGAMHLTSTPNTLQTELALAGGATVLRQGGNQDPQELICCAQYGQAYRNSDPHIGQQVNLLVSSGHTVSLADPVGLYMQAPNFGRYALPSDPKLPADAKPADCWHVLRGAAVVKDPVTGQPYPGNMILHAAFQLPQAWIDAGVAFTVGDITIAGEPISWGGQIVRTMNIGLFPRPLPSSVPAAQPCVAPSQVVEVQPLQQFHAALWDAYYGTPEKNPVNEPMSLASNTVIVPPQVPQGAQQVALALTCSGVDGQPAPQVTFPPGGDLVATDVKLVGDVNYAVPGNSYPGQCQLLTFTLDVAADAQVGLRSVVVTNAGGASGEPAPAFLEVVPAGS